jgi:putative transposase
MVSEHQVSERRACRLVGLSRDSYRHPPQADQASVALHEKIVAANIGSPHFFICFKAG